MSLVRAHLPKNLRSSRALKALIEKVLKYYIVDRLPHWNSTSGIIYEWTKLAVNKATAGFVGTDKTSKDIMDDCSTIKFSIENASKYSDYIALITLLLEKVAEAKKSEIPMISDPSLRGDLYYTIITLIYEILAIDFEKEYTDDIEKHRKGFFDAETDYERLSIQGSPCEKILETIDAHLKELVILGDRKAYFYAFKRGANPFPKIFTKQYNKDTFYIDPDVASSFITLIHTQMDMEQGGHVALDAYTKPNANLPYFLQPDFAMIFCLKKLHKSLAYITHHALAGYDNEFGKTFWEIYIADRERFVAENRPDDVVKRAKNASDSPDGKDSKPAYMSEQEQTNNDEAAKAAAAAEAKTEPAPDNNQNVQSPPEHPESTDISDSPAKGEAKSQPESVTPEKEKEAATPSVASNSMFTQPGESLSKRARKRLAKAAEQAGQLPEVQGSPTMANKQS